MASVKYVDVKWSLGGISYEIPKIEFQKRSLNKKYLDENMEVFEDWLKNRVDEGSFINDSNDESFEKIFLTGCIVLYPDHYVFIEGSKGFEKKYRLSAKTERDEDLGDETNGINKSMLLWEGKTKEYSFGDVEFKTYSIKKTILEK